MANAQPTFLCIVHHWCSSFSPFVICARERAALLTTCKSQSSRLCFRVGYVLGNSLGQTILLTRCSAKDAAQAAIKMWMTPAILGKPIAVNIGSVDCSSHCGATRDGDRNRSAANIAAGGRFGGSESVKAARVHESLKFFFRRAR